MAGLVSTPLATKEGAGVTMDSEIRQNEQWCQSQAYTQSGGETSGFEGEKEEPAILDLHLTQGILLPIHHGTELCSMSPAPSSFLSDTITIIHLTRFSDNMPGTDIGFVGTETYTT